MGDMKEPPPFVAKDELLKRAFESKDPEIKEFVLGRVKSQGPGVFKDESFRKELEARLAPKAKDSAPRQEATVRPQIPEAKAPDEKKKPLAQTPSDFAAEIKKVNPPQEAEIKAVNAVPTCVGNSGLPPAQALPTGLRQKDMAELISIARAERLEQARARKEARIEMRASVESLRKKQLAKIARISCNPDEPQNPFRKSEKKQAMPDMANFPSPESMGKPPSMADMKNFPPMGDMKEFPPMGDRKNLPPMGEMPMGAEGFPEIPEGLSVETLKQLKKEMEELQAEMKEDVQDAMKAKQESCLAEMKRRMPAPGNMGMPGGSGTPSPSQFGAGQQSGSQWNAFFSLGQAGMPSQFGGGMGSTGGMNSMGSMMGMGGMGGMGSMGGMNSMGGMGSMGGMMGMSGMGMPGLRMGPSMPGMGFPTSSFSGGRW